MLLAVLLALPACGGLTPSLINEGPRLNDAPDELHNPCAKPLRLPERELTQAEVESFWLRDRENLIACGLDKEALLEFYLTRDAGLRGGS